MRLCMRFLAMVTGMAVLVVAVTVICSSAQVTSPTQPLAEVTAADHRGGDRSGHRGPALKLQEQIYTLRRQRLEPSSATDCWLEKPRRRGIAVQKLLDAEVTSRSPS